MNSTLKILAIVVLSLVVVGALIGAGFLVGRAVTGRQLAVVAGGADGSYPYGMGPGMMPGWGDEVQPYGRGRTPGRDDGQRFDRGGRSGTMDGFGGMPMFGQGASAEPLTIEAARTAVEGFLTKLGRDNLALGEIMIFENNAYAVIDDTATGQGAFEVLVDSLRQVVHLEYGPSMMWNTVYGMHGSDPIFGVGRMPGGMAGGMMEGYGPQTAPTSDTPLTEAQAREKAQAYVDASLAGQTLSATAEAFPGYFTFDTEKDGTPSGMLSVNAATGQVWLHTWHGAFIEMYE